MFAESVDLMVSVAMVSLGENKDWIGPWMSCESRKITVDMSFLHALSSIPVSRLKPILDEADLRSLRRSDWFKLKWLWPFRLINSFPAYQHFLLKHSLSKLSSLIKVWDLLNISNIFRDHRVTSEIRQNFRESWPSSYLLSVQKSY